MRGIAQYSPLGFAALALLVSVVDARLYPGLPEFVAAKEAAFDFIIVGGGTAGSVLANRLSENPLRRVLLLEAGPNNVPPQPELEVPGLNPNISNYYQWNYTTVPQAGANGRILAAPRGYVLGGSSSINGMVYTRGAKDDFNFWGKVTNDARWTYNALLPWLTKHEKWTPPVGGRDPTGQFHPLNHGFTGPICTALTWSGPSAFDDRNTKNVLSRPKEFRNKLDSNDGEPIGLSWTQFTFGGGIRNSAATGYLDDSTRQRKNLVIVVNAEGKRIKPSTSRASGNLDIRTVEVGSRSNNITVTLTAKRELILSGGAYGTPHILLNSGIGERAHLQSVGIPVILNLPDVGKGLVDHPAAFAVWNTTNVPAPVNDTADIARWKVNDTGPMSEYPLIGRRILWARIPDNSSIWKTYRDPSSGPTSPHIEITVGQTGVILVAVVALSTPQSRGTVKLASNNPFDAPLIDPGYLTHPFDIEAIKEGVRISKSWYSGNAWDGWITGFVGPDPDTLPADAYASALKASFINTHHAVATAAMSARGAAGGVVDPDLKVKGVDGLRIVDASVLPHIPSGHTSAPVYILSERAADIIKAANIL